MPTICIQCSMRALLDNQPPPTFEETPEEHRLKYHPDPVKTQQERDELNRRFAAKYEKELKDD